MFVYSRVMNVLMPGRVKLESKTFQTPSIPAMKTMRERERIALFTNLVQEYGIQDTFTFPTESLHEKGALNLAQVCTCLRALGMQVGLDYCMNLSQRCSSHKLLVCAAISGIN